MKRYMSDFIADEPPTEMAQIAAQMPPPPPPPLQP